MKEFIKKNILFVLLPIVCYISGFEFLKIKLENNIFKSDAIILGDSHTQPLNIPNFYNYSFNGSPYIIHYNFLQSIKDKIKGKMVLIAFGHHNISPLYENRFNQNVVRTSWIAMVNQHLNSVSFLPKFYNYSWQNNVEESIFSKSKLTSLYHLSYKKPTVNTNKVSTDTISFEHTLETHYNNPNYITADIIQEKYLSLIIELLREQDCQIILLNTPVTEYYFDNIPAYIKKKHSYLINSFKTAQYLDLNKLLEDNIDFTIFKDADHVNQKGDSLIIRYITKNVVKTNARTHNNVYTR